MRFRHQNHFSYSLASQKNQFCYFALHDSLLLAVVLSQRELFNNLVFWGFWRFLATSYRLISLSQFVLCLSRVGFAIAFYTS